MVEQVLDSLLKEVAFKIGTLQEAKRRFSAQLAPEFKIFDYLRTDEMGFSRCIASLLDPNGTHGQGRIFLDAFLDKIDAASNWGTMIDDCRVITEKQANGMRRIDIYLELQGIGCIGIENKPWAGDQDQQLSDYAQFLEKTAGGRKWLLIYFSNRDPSEESISSIQREALEESGNFIRLNYANVNDWLDECASKSKALVVRVFIEELAKFIRMDVNGELDMSEEQELKSIILKSKENLESAFHVLRGIESVKYELIKDFKLDLENKLKANGFELVWDQGMSKGWKSCVGFGVKFGNVARQNKYLRFEFNNSGLNGFFWGIRRDDDSVMKDAIWNEIQDVMEKQFSPGKSSNWWPWYTTLPDQEFDAHLINWYVQEHAWLAVKEGSLAIKITDLAIRVQAAFKRSHMLRAWLEDAYVTSDNL